VRGYVGLVSVRERMWVLETEKPPVRRLSLMMANHWPPKRFPTELHLREVKFRIAADSCGTELCAPDQNANSLFGCEILRRWLLYLLQFACRSRCLLFSMICIGWTARRIPYIGSRVRTPILEFIETQR
jgi:hypothetical protein